MLAVFHLNITDVTSKFCQFPGDGVEWTGWNAFCRERGLFALVADADGTPVGLTVAESTPEVVRFLALEGNAAACSLLLERLLRMAGERDVGGWCPTDRYDLRGLLDGAGFRRRTESDCRGQPCCYYHLSRNESA